VTWIDGVHYLTVLVVWSVWILWALSFRWPRLWPLADIGNGTGIWLCACTLAIGAADGGAVAILLAQVAIQNALIRRLPGLGVARVQ
jgi:hypothetical protein